MATFRANIRENMTNGKSDDIINTEQQEKNRTVNLNKSYKYSIKKAIPQVLLALQCPSQLYMFLYHIIPRLFENYSETTQIFWKLFACFCCFEFLINYFLTLYTDSSINVHDFSQGKLVPKQLHTNGYVQNGTLLSCNVDDIPWRLCKKCNIYVPPRTYHCLTCKKCILKREHHCLLVGTCVGFYNQRYFLVLGIYAILCGLVALLFNMYYLYLFYWPIAYSWASFIPIVGIFRFCFGYENIEQHMLTLVWQAYLQLFVGCFGCFVVYVQIRLCLVGKTEHEFDKKLPITNSSSVADNFKSIFGDFWLLNFIFPMALCCKQPGDGTRWPGLKIELPGPAKDDVVLHFE